MYAPAVSRMCAPRPYVPFDDSTVPDETYFRELERVCRHRIIWGGNFMLDYLGRASCMIVWDKARRGLSQADCEIAWTDFAEQSRVFNWKWNGMLQQDMKHKEERVHPCQKPVALYQWILDRWAKPGMRILDTHVGSGSSLIACERAGLTYWGFEISEHYYNVAKERIEKEQAQMSLLTLVKDGEGDERNGSEPRGDLSV